MDINKSLCEKLYTDVKLKLQEAFLLRGMTYRGAETYIWKLEEAVTGKTHFQIILEENTGISFSTTFNNMYLWRKRNELQEKESVNFREDYLHIFMKFLGYPNPQVYVNQFAQTLHNTFGIKQEGKILVVQPIFDSNKEAPMVNMMGKFPTANEHSHDSLDTECLLELINIFQDNHHSLPKRVYDQDLIVLESGKYCINDLVLQQNNANCIFSIGFYSNYFTLWALSLHANQFIEYFEKPLRFRVKYFNPHLQRPCWSDVYESNEQFDAGFLLKLPLAFAHETINCYFLCGIANKGTRAITTYLCQNWKMLQQKQDAERNIPVFDDPFIIIFKSSKSDLMECYIEKVVKIDF